MSVKRADARFLKPFEERTLKQREVQAVRVLEVLHVRVVGLTKCDPGRLGGKSAELLQRD